MRRLLPYALHHRFLTVVLGVGLVALGIWSFQQLKIEAYPDISDTQVVVITLSPGSAAEEVEQQVTVPIERALNSVPNVIARRSRTIFGLSVVELTFAYGTDDYFARQVVLEKLRDAALPDGVTPTLGPAVDADRRVLPLRRRGERPRRHGTARAAGLGDRAALPAGAGRRRRRRRSAGWSSNTRSRSTRCALEKYNLTDRADRAGGRGQQPERRRRAARQRPAVDGDPRRRADPSRRTTSRTSSWRESQGRAGLRARHRPRVRSARRRRPASSASDEQTGGVEGIVLMRRGENPTEVLQRDPRSGGRAQREPAAAGRADLAASTTARTWSPTRCTRSSHTLLEGLVIVVIVLLAVSGQRARGAADGDHDSAVAAVRVRLHALHGIPANLLSLGALDFGIIVDGTLVMVEHIVHRLARARSRSDVEPRCDETIRDAALEVEPPIFFSLLIIISAYIPLFTLERVERRLFTPMAFTVCFALLGSMLLALTLIPVLATYLFRNGRKTWRQPGAASGCTTATSGSLRLTLRARRSRWSRRRGRGRRRAFVLAAPLGTEFLPQLDEGVIWVRANLPAGISLEKSAETAARIREHPRAVPRGEAGELANGPQRLRHRSVRPEPQRVLRRAEAVRHLAAGDAQARRWSTSCRSGSQPTSRARASASRSRSSTTSTETVTGSSADLAVIISGPDLTRLRGLAGQSLDVVRRFPARRTRPSSRKPTRRSCAS